MYIDILMDSSHFYPWGVVSLALFSLQISADYLFKFLVIGNAGVGKSCLLHQFIEQKCEFIIRES